MWNIFDWKHTETSVIQQCSNLTAKTEICWN